MNKFFCCSCSNVSIEFSEDENQPNSESNYVVEWETQNRQAIDVHAPLLQVDLEAKDKTVEILRRHFLISSRHFTVRANDYQKEQDLTPSCVKIKYPQLVGQLTKPNHLAKNVNYTIFKCINCNIFTHYVATVSTRVGMSNQLARLNATSTHKDQSLASLVNNENSNSSNLSIGSASDFNNQPQHHHHQHNHNLQQQQTSLNQSNHSTTTFMVGSIGQQPTSDLLANKSLSQVSCDTGYGGDDSNDSVSLANKKIFILSNQMISNEDELIALKESSNYSFIYDLLFVNASTNLDNVQENIDMNLQLVNGSSFDSFLEQLNRIYELKCDIYKNEANFREILEKLVKTYASVYAEQQEKQSNSLNFSSKILKFEQHQQQDTGDVERPFEALEKNKSENESMKTNKKKQRKASFKEILTDNVFELEEAESGPFESDVDDERLGDESVDVDEYSSFIMEKPDHASINQQQQQQQPQLSSPTRNSSNISMVGMFSRARTLNQANNSNKYSCSLPREIPMLTNKLSLGGMKSSQNDLNESDSEIKEIKEINRLNNEKLERERLSNAATAAAAEGSSPSPTKEFDFVMNANPTAPKMSSSINISSSFKNSLSRAINKSSGEELADANNEEDIFSDYAAADVDNNDDDLSNMGQAISNLASSIVQKDGRELFGGVPSRRIPINSISKSCFD